MQIGTLAPVGVTHPAQTPLVSEISRQERQGVMKEPARPSAEPRASSEEILKKIQSLTEGGQHSVRFEMDKDVNVLVVKVYDSKTEELVRQIPAESLLGTVKALQEYRRGLLVDDQS